jgi:uncharacterized repeat protein (TIGR01451 family)/CSLREA domain-containing protein
MFMFTPVQRPLVTRFALFVTIWLLALAAVAPNATAAVFVVNVTTDDAPDGACNGGTSPTPPATDCTLREAIIAANATAGGDEIRLTQIAPATNATTYTLTIPGADDTAAAGDLDITESVTIGTVSGGGYVIVRAGTTKGAGIDRVFHINPNTNRQMNVTFNRVHIMNGTTTGRGGGIHFDGNNAGTASGELRLEHSSVIDNQADIEGGGIYARDLPTFFIRLGSDHAQTPQATIQGNVAGRDVLAPNGDGGAIWSFNSNLIIFDGQVNGVKENEATRHGGGIYVSGGNPSGASMGQFNRFFGLYNKNKGDRDNNGTGDGGAFYVVAGATIDINANGVGFGVAANGNTAVNGGAVANFGTTTLGGNLNNFVDNNQAKNHGGAVYNGSTGTFSTSTGSSEASPANFAFTRNIADSDSNGTGNGGAIYNDGGTVTVTRFPDNNSTPPLKQIFLGNQAQNGGAVATAGGSTTINTLSAFQNTAVGSGGAFFVSGGAMTLCEVYMSQNTGTITGGAVAQTGGTLNISLSRFDSNTSPSGTAIRASGTVTAENNWWGCDGFPNSAGCETVVGGTVDSNPRLDLRAVPQTSTIAPGASISIDADVTKNSDGNTPPACNGVRPSPLVLLSSNTFAVTFSTQNGLGSVSPTNTSMARTSPTPGQASTTFTAGGTTGTEFVNISAFGGTQQATVNIAVGAPQVDVSIAKGVDNTAPEVNANVVFTVTVANSNAAGINQATGVQVRDILPAGLQFVSASATSGTYDSAAGIWTVGTINPGTSFQLQITAKVLTTGTKTNQAEITNVNQADIDTTNHVATASVTPLASDLEMTMTPSATAVPVGSDVTYTIKVLNKGPDDTSGVTAQINLHADLAYASHSGDGTFDSATGVWTIGTLSNGGEATLVLTATATAAGNNRTTSGYVTASAHADPDSSTADTFGDDSAFSNIHTVAASANLAMDKAVDNATPAIGANVVFTLTVTNAGPHKAIEVLVNDDLPSGLTYVSHSAGETYDPATGIWNVGSIANGGTRTLQITATVTTSGAKTNSAQITSLFSNNSARGGDPNLSNNSDSVIVTPLRADLSVTKSVSPKMAQAGGTVTFTVTVSAASGSGLGAAENVVVTDALGAGLTHTGNTPSQGTFNPATGVWNVGTINAGSSATLQLTATVSASGSKMNRAQVTSVSQADPDSTPNNNDAFEDDDARVVVTLNKGGGMFCAEGSIELNTAGGGPIGDDPCDDNSVLMSGPPVASHAIGESADVGGNAVIGANPAPATMYPSVIQVAGLSPSTVVSLKVHLKGLKSQRPADLDMMLVAPDGTTKAMIWSDAGGRVQNLNFNTTGINVTLADGGADGPLPAQDAFDQMESGEYQPTNYQSTCAFDGADGFPAPAPAPGATLVSALSTFAGANANGTWKLYIVDDEFNSTPLDSSIANGWCLEIVTNSPPTAVNDGPNATLTVAEGGTLTITAPGVLANDTDPENDALTAVVSTEPANDSSFALNANGGFTYTHNGSETTSDTFTYFANDGFSNSATAATVTITITPLNDPPSFTSTPVTTANEDAAYSYSITTADPDTAGSGRTITATTKPAWLTFTDNGNGTATLTGTPTNSEVGSHNVVLQVTDGDATVQQSFTITVANTNDAPTFTSTPVTTATEDSAYTYNVTTADVDVGDSLTITAPTKPAWLTLTDNGNGTAVLSGTPTNDHVGSHNVVLEVSDGTATGQQSFTITVTNTNDAPSFTSTPVTAATEDSAYSYSITAADADAGDSVTLTAPTKPAWLTFTVTGAGTATLTGTPTNGEVGSHNVVLEATDGTATTQQSFTITVANTNDAPAFTSTPVTSATEDSAYSYSITSSDVDAGDTLTITAPTKPSWLTLVDNGNGTATLSGTPLNQHVGANNVVLELTDGTVTVQQSFTITVTNTNDAPSFTSTPVTAATEDSAYSYSITAADVDAGDSVTLTAPTKPAWLTFTVTGPGTATLTGTPSNADVGTHNVVLEATDGTATTQQSFTITVANTNDAPAFTSTPVTSATEDSAYSYSITSSDVDAGDTLTITAPTKPSWLTLVDNGNGTATLSGTPLNEHVGANNVVLELTDGAATVQQSFTITVTNTNDAPTFTSTPVTAATEDAPYSYSITAADIDAGDSVTLTAPTKPAWLTFTVTGPGTATLTGTPTNDHVGTHNVVLEATDGTATTQQSFTIIVGNTNDAPAFTSTPVTSATEDAPYNYSITAADVDAGDTLTITAPTKPSWLTLTATGNGTATLSGTPLNEHVGTHNVVLELTDGTVTVQQSFTITVTNTNDAPTFTSTPVTAATEDAPYSYSITAADVDAGDSVTLTAPTKPAWLTFTVTGPGTATLTGTPSNADVGTHNVVLEVTDGTATTQQSFTITVANTNDAPAFTSTSVTTATEDSAYSYSITSSDVDAGDTLTITAPTKPSWLTLTPTGNGTATLSGTPLNQHVGTHNVVLELTDGAATVQQSFTITVTNTNDAPAFTSTPVTGATEDAPYSYSITAADVDAGDSVTLTAPTKPAWLTFTVTGPGTATLTGTPSNADVGTHNVVLEATDGTATTQQSFTIMVANTNDAPAFTSTPVTSATEDAPYNYSITAADADTGDTLTITAPTKPSWLTLTATGNGTATLSGTPLNEHVGTHNVVLELTDGTVTVQQSFTITVANTNDAPTFTSTPVTAATENTPYSYSIATADVDAGDSVTLTAPTKPAWLTFTVTGSGTATLTGTPSNADVGNHNVVLEATDGTATVQQSFTIVVANTNDAPVFTSTPVTTATQNSPYHYAVTALDSDAGDTIAIAATVKPSWLTLTDNGNGTATLSGTPLNQHVGTHNVVLQVTDGSATAEQSFTITVANVNDAPVAVGDHTTTNQGAPVTIDVVANDSDADGDTLTVIAASTPAHGTATCAGTQCTYTPAPGYHGPDGFTYTISDGHGGTATATVTIAVVAQNAPPVAVNDAYGTAAGAALAVPASSGVLANDSDPEGNPLTAVLAATVQHGNLTLAPDGSFTYTPNAGFSGTDSFTYRASDATSLSNVATVSIGVSSTPEPVTATVTGGGAICSGRFIAIHAALTGTAPWQIEWSDGVTQTTFAREHTRVVSPATTTTYSIVSVRDANGSGTASGAAVVTVNEAPNPRIDGPSSVARGAPMTLATTAGFESYQWLLNGVPIAGAVTNRYEVAALATSDLGTYAVRVAANGCESTSAPFIVTLSNEAIVAVIGEAPGANGSHFKSVLFLSNPTASALAGEIRFIVAGEVVRVVRYAIPPGATQYLTDFLPAGFVGLATGVVVPDGPLPVVIAHVYNDAGANGTFGMIQTPVVAEKVLRQGARAVLIAPANAAATRFNVGVRALSDGAALRVVSRNAAGDLISTVQRAYSAHSLTHASAADLLGRNVGASETLTFEVLSGAAVIYGTPTDNRTNDPNIQFAAPVVSTDGGRERHIITVAGSARGAFGSLFKTGVQIHNPSSQRMTARFIFHPMATPGSASDPSHVVTIEPFATLAIDDLLLPMGQSGIGSVDVDVDGRARPIAAVRVFNDGSEGQTSMSQALLRPSDAIAAGKSATILAPHDPTNARFNLGVRTLGGGARIIATIRGHSGAVLRTVELTYPADYFVQNGASAMLGHTFTSDESITFAVAEGSAIVYGVWTDNVSQDPSFHFAQ